MSNSRFGFRTRNGSVRAFIQGNAYIFPILDIYPNAAAAYSLRKLRNAYSGSAIRVRRSSDNAEQNIGFDGVGNLNTTSLTSFVGANNGFITTWYDQSGNARNATQSTASNQPQIVNSGNILTTNGRPRIDFDGINDSLSITSFTYSSANYNSFVGKRGASGRYLFGLSGTGTIPYLWGLWSDNKYYYQGNINGFQGSTSTDYSTSQLLLTGLRESGGNQRLYKNGIETASSFNSSSSTNNISSIGLYNSSYAYCELQEIIYYNSAQESNRIGIESNINSYYTIY